MQAKNQAGSIVSAGLIVVLAVALAGALGFGLKAAQENRNTKNNLDKLVAAEVEKAKKTEAEKLQSQFDEKEKSPLKTYTSPVTYGLISFSYPKTWSAYVNDSNSSQPLNAYFHPDIVPAAQTTAYALRLELVSTPYASVLQQYESQIKSGKLKAVAYIPPKMNGVANTQPGTKLDGALSSSQSGSMVILKIRDKTLKVYSLSPNFVPDFSNTILPSLTFTP